MPPTTPTALRTLLFERGVRQIEVAAKLGMSNSLLCLYLTGKRPLPEDFDARFRGAVEEAAAEKAAKLQPAVTAP